MFEHFIVAMHKDNDGKECFKRYGIHEIDELEAILDRCEFIAHCIAEDIMDYVLTTENVIEKLNLKEYIEIDESLFRCQKPFLVNIEKFFVSMIIEVNDIKTLHKLGKEMVKFVRQTEGAFGKSAEEENASQITWLIENSKEMVEECAFYIFD